MGFIFYGVKSFVQAALPAAAGCATAVVGCVGGVKCAKLVSSIVKKNKANPAEAPAK